MPSAVDVTDSSHILRSPGIHTTIGEYPSSSIATSPIFDDTDEEVCTPHALISLRAQAVLLGRYWRVIIGNNRQQQNSFGVPTSLIS